MTNFFLGKRLGYWAPGFVWLGVGFNIAPYHWRFDRIMSALHALPMVEVMAISKPLMNPAQGSGVNGQFCNAAALLYTKASPDNLLQQLKRLEVKLGRHHAGNRPADFDILLWWDRLGWRSLKTQTLSIPHAAMHLRPFVIKPLVQLPLPVLSFHVSLKMQKLLRQHTITFSYQ